jgi:hypothetical protein
METGVPKDVPNKAVPITAALITHAAAETTTTIRAVRVMVDSSSHP